MVVGQAQPNLCIIVKGMVTEEITPLFKYLFRFFDHSTLQYLYFYEYDVISHNIIQDTEKWYIYAILTN